jgi:hypothetical protein
MRVRITEALTGSIDGIQLSRFSKGQVYDLYTSLACYLLAERLAEPAADDAPTSVLPVENQMFGPLGPPAPAEPRKGIVLPRAIAADRPSKKKKS